MLECCLPGAPLIGSVCLSILCSFVAQGLDKLLMQFFSVQRNVTWLTLFYVRQKRGQFWLFATSHETKAWNSWPEYDQKWTIPTIVSWAVLHSIYRKWNACIMSIQVWRDPQAPFHHRLYSLLMRDGRTVFLVFLALVLGIYGFGWPISTQSTVTNRLVSSGLTLRHSVRTGSYTKSTLDYLAISICISLLLVVRKAIKMLGSKVGRKISVERNHAFGDALWEAVFSLSSLAMGMHVWKTSTYSSILSRNAYIGYPHYSSTLGEAMFFLSQVSFYLRIVLLTTHVK